MSQVSYQAGSARARQARLRRRLGSASVPIGWVVLALLGAGGAWLAVQNQPFGWPLVGIGLLLGVFQLWNIWWLRPLPVAASWQGETVQLDQAIEPNLLGAITWPAEPAQLWRAAVGQWQGVFMVNRLGIPVDLVSQLLDQDHNADVWSGAVELATSHRCPQIDGGVLAAAILTKTPALKTVLTHLQLDADDVINVLLWQQRLSQAMSDLSRKPVFGGIGRDWASGYTPILNRFAKNLTREIEYGYYRHLPQVHESVVDQLEGYLAGNRASVALLGDVGSGKTSIVYSLAERLLQGKAEGHLEYYYVMQLNASVLISAGEQVEEVVLRVLSEASHARNVIIFLDEAQLFFGTGTGAVDLSQVLLPILQQGSVKMVMAMTPQDWQNLIGRNPSLATSIQRLAVTAPAEADSLKIMEDAAIGVEHQAKTLVSYQAIKEAYRLADRYLTESAFPGKGISVLESATHFPHDGIIVAASVQAAIEGMVGTKVTAAGSAEKAQLLNLEDEIHKRMVNQTRAVKVVADALRRARAGVRNPNRPVGSFLFLGPTGVGKTELARALADSYFGGQDRIVRVDMSEYQQPSDVTRLLQAAPAGRSGSTLVSGIRHQPFSVVLFDEIEKAHPDILNLLLQLLDEGRLTDSDGRVASFKDAIVIATSNAAADTIREKIAAGAALESFEDEITNGLIDSHQFRAELLNRFDEIVLFRPLTQPELRQVVNLMIAEVNQTLSRQKVSVTITDAAADWLVEQGYDPRLGARPLRRMVQRAVENTVAQRILAETVQPGEQLRLDVADLQSSATP